MQTILNGFKLVSPIRNVRQLTGQIGKLDKYGALHVNLTESSTCDQKLPDKLCDICNSGASPTALWVYLNRYQFPIITRLCAPLPTGPGLVFHHASGLTVTLFRWLAGGPSRVPDFATHQLGVAAVLPSPSSEHILMIREKSSSSGFRGWKFPTGLANLGEDISVAVLRELYEETGISAEFSGIIALRQHHDFSGAFGRSDFLVACRLQLPKACESLPSIRPCANEIAEGQWMPLTELKAAQVHCVIGDAESKSIDWANGIHITTYTKQILRLFTSKKHSINSIEMRPHRFNSTRAGQWYDLYLPE